MKFIVKQRLFFWDWCFFFFFPSFQYYNKDFIKLPLKLVKLIIKVPFKRLRTLKRKLSICYFFIFFWRILQITPKIFLHKFNRFYRKKYITLFKKYYQYTDLLFFVEFIYFYIFTKLINIEDIESIPLLGKQLSLYYILTEKKLIVFFWDIASFTLKPFKVKITGIRRRFRQNFLMSLSFFFKINTYLPLTKFFTFIQFFNFFFFL